MTPQEALTVAICATHSDGVEARYVWEELTVAFPELDWRAAFKSAAVSKRHYYAEEVDEWDSPCVGELRLMQQFKARIHELEQQVSKLRKPLGEQDESDH